MTRQFLLILNLFFFFTATTIAQNSQAKEKYSAHIFSGQFDALTVSGNGTIYIKQGQHNAIIFPKKSNTKYNPDNIADHLYIKGAADSILLIITSVNKLSNLTTRGNVNVVFLSPITSQNPLIESYDTSKVSAIFNNTILITIRASDHSYLRLKGDNNMGLTMELKDYAYVAASEMKVQNLSIDLKGHSTAKADVTGGIADGTITDNSVVFLQLHNAISDIKQNGRARIVKK